MNDDWTRTDTENPGYVCRICQSPDVVYRTHEDTEGHVDLEYHCHGCTRRWWIDGADY